MLNKRNFNRSLVTAVIMALFTIGSVYAHNHKETKSDIVTTAVKAGNFTILAKALQAAGLVDALKAEGPFTVFAPTDDAFAKLPEGTIESLLNDKEKLTNILLYHVVAGNVKSKDVISLDKATTLAKSDVMINFDGESVKINDSMVTTVDIEASNGTIHVIDTVLIPEVK